VVFNDSSLISLSSDTSLTTYWDGNSNSVSSSSTQPNDSHTKFHKRLTLLSYFQGYLRNCSASAGLELALNCRASLTTTPPVPNPKNVNTNTIPFPARTLDDGPIFTSTHINIDTLTSTSCARSSGIYVKKWFKSPQGMIFLLSNNTLQINFFDHTKIMVNAEVPNQILVLCVTPKGVRHVHTLKYLRKLAPELSMDFIRRLMYAMCYYEAEVKQHNLVELSAIAVPLTKHDQAQLM